MLSKITQMHFGLEFKLQNSVQVQLCLLQVNLFLCCSGCIRLDYVILTVIELDRVMLNHRYYHLKITYSGKDYSWMSSCDVQGNSDWLHFWTDAMDIGWSGSTVWTFQKWCNRLDTFLLLNSISQNFICFK